MENIFNSILLFIITALLTSIGLGLRKVYSKHLNKIDIIEWKTESINYSCEQVLPPEYKEKRNEKWADLVEENELKNKER